MPYGYSTDPEVDRSTNRWMVVGAVLIFGLIAMFPLYLAVEPTSREQTRKDTLASLATEGKQLFEFNCASCHGANGEGVSAPALNAKQFLQTATNEQIESLVSVGVPGTPMSAFSQDHGGPLTSEQVAAVTAYLRSWEKNAPDKPNWRTPNQ